MSLSDRWSRATDWAFMRFTRQPMRRGKAAATVAALIALIGVADWFTGVHFSLFIFYLVPVCLAASWLGGTGSLCAVAATTGVRVYTHYHDFGFKPLPFYTWWNLGCSVAVFLLISGTIHALLELHRDLERRVEERTRALHAAAAAEQRLQRELIDISARERNLIGRELHDELGQHLVGTALATQVLMERLKGRSDAAADDAGAIVRWVQEGISKTRQIARGLLLSSIEPHELSQELSELAAASSRGGVVCRFRQEGEPETEDAAAAAQLLRIAQEATRNALHHAEARHVDITLTGRDGSTCLMVEDDGCGLPPPDERGDGMGLRIMEHRAALAGGTLSVLAMPGEGTRVICRLPAAVAVP